jgi:carnitine-CoA ligase
VQTDGEDAVAQPTGVVPVAKAVPLRERTIPCLIDRGSELWPERLALRQRDFVLTYAALRHAVRHRGRALASLGVSWQSPVLMMMDNHLDHVLTWLGASYYGRVQIQVNTAYRGSLLIRVLQQSGADTIVAEDRYCERLAAVAADVPGLRRVIVRDGDGSALRGSRLAVVPFAEAFPAERPDAAGDGAGAEPDPTESVAPWHVYGVMYTSGTTGPSKGVVLPHALPFGYVSPETVALVDHDDVVLVPFPQFHISGQWTGVLAPLMVGGSAVLVERFSASTFWADVRRYGITQTTLLSAMVPFLMGQPERADDAETTLRKVVMAPVIAESASFELRFGLSIASCYGQTEACLPVVSWYGTTTPAACGWARPEFEVRLVDENDLEVAPGQVGELVVRAREPYLSMVEYLDAPAATVAKWRNLWLHTGDMHRQDETGQFYFVDRRGDVLRRRGENISSLELEAEIQRVPQVQMVAVVGIDSPDLEQEIKACLVLKPGATVTHADLHAEFISRLPYFMVPRYLEFYDDLPRTPTQRIQKSSLRAAGVTDATWDARAHSLEPRHSGR